MIEEDLLYQFGAELRSYKKKATIFNEGQNPLYYYQIKEGSVKLNNYKDDGKEFIQNIFYKNQSFGESLLFLDIPYPLNAISLAECEIYQLPKNSFHELLQKNAQVSYCINKILSQRLYYKYRMLLNLSSTEPHVRLSGLMDYLKSFQMSNAEQAQNKHYFEVPLTRQQLANLTGLCVETVIRTIKKMAKENQLLLEDRKILY